LKPYGNPGFSLNKSFIATFIFIKGTGVVYVLEEILGTGQIGLYL
jgi:hypothetical protein